jgi:cytoskeleton protein RodZ
MSEPVLMATPEMPPVPSVASARTSGVILREAREALGMDIELLAAVLKVPVKKLEALEADRFDLLPDTVFVRALASSVCRSVKIDPTPVLAGLPHSSAPPLKVYESSINVPFRSAGAGGPLVLLWNQLPKPVVIAVAALLVGMLLLWFVPLGTHTESVAGNKTETSAALVPQVAARPGVTVNEKPLTPPVPSPGSADEPLTQVAGSGATTGVIVFSASAMSWVEVVDAAGVVQLRRNIGAGEVVGVSGVLPLSVVVGRSDTTLVQVHGKPFDLLSIARDNVARFEVK